MIMHATVCSVDCPHMLVCDHCTRQEVAVHMPTPCHCCFCPGDCVCIEFSGAMTASLPPQISADCIRLISCRCRRRECC